MKWQYYTRSNTCTEHSSRIIGSISYVASVNSGNPLIKAIRTLRSILVMGDSSYEHDEIALPLFFLRHLTISSCFHRHSFNPSHRTIIKLILGSSLPSSSFVIQLECTFFLDSHIVSKYGFFSGFYECFLFE